MDPWNFQGLMPYFNNFDQNIHPYIAPYLAEVIERTSHPGPECEQPLGVTGWLRSSHRSPFPPLVSVMAPFSRHALLCHPAGALPSHQVSLLLAVSTPRGTHIVGLCLLCHDRAVLCVLS